MSAPFTRFAFLIVPLLLPLMAGCAAPPPPQWGEPTGERRVRYVCDNREDIEMRFFPLQGVGVLVRHGKTVELQQLPAASGFLYSNGPITVRGKGDDLTVEIGRMVPIQCRAAAD